MFILVYIFEAWRNLFYKIDIKYDEKLYERQGKEEFKEFKK